MRRNFYGDKILWYTNHRVTSYELQVIILSSCIYCISYELSVTFITRFTSYFLDMTYELLTIRLTFYIRFTSYCVFKCHDLLLLHELPENFWMRVPNPILLHELRVTSCIQVTNNCLLVELQVTFYMRVTSSCLLYELRGNF